MWAHRSGRDNMQDAFSKYHPAVNFAFFVGAIACSVVIQHPAYLFAGCVGSAVYYLLLRGARGWKAIFGLLPFCIILTAVNPLFNTQGQHILFHVFDRPYTAQSLLYGAAVAGIFLVTMLWFGCYNAVMTSDKFTTLFGTLIPSLSLLLVMVFRMVPNLIRKTRQIAASRKSIGRGPGEHSSYQDKLNNGMTVLSAITSWALEGGVVTADSMRTRGYGVGPRSSFQIYRITLKDLVLLVLQLLLISAVITAAALGQTAAAFTPEFSAAPISWGLAAYCMYLFLPTALHIKEAIQWHILRSKI